MNKNKKENSVLNKRSNIVSKLLLSASVVALGISAPSFTAYADTCIGSQSRTITCKNHLGETVPNTHCNDLRVSPMPTPPTQSCPYYCAPPVYYGDGGDGDGDGDGYTGGGWIDTTGNGLGDTRASEAPRGTRGRSSTSQGRRTNGRTWVSRSGSISGTHSSGITGRTSSSSSSSSSSGCFIAGTLVDMADGSKKPIEDIKLGDIVKEGGRVLAAGSLYTYDLYDYKNVHVSGSHAVLENNIWIRVRDSKYAALISEEETVVYVHSNEHCRIIINNITFADLTEFSIKNTNVHNIYHDELLKLLNEREQIKKVA